ncbi:hypothetical protein BH10CYA1_BH10CYA1_17940 [soil metagenome]
MSAQVPQHRKIEDNLIVRETQPEPGRPASLDKIVSAMVALANMERCQGAVKFKDVHGTWHHVKISYTFDGSHPSIAMSLDITISTEIYKFVKGAGRIPEWQDVPRALVLRLDECWFVADCVYGTNLASGGLIAIKRVLDRQISPLERHALKAWISTIR